MFSLAADFLVELLAVVSGIVIAFQLDRWNTRRLEAGRTRGYLERLQEDIDSDLKRMERVMATSKQRLGYTQTLIKSLTDDSIPRNDPGGYIVAMAQVASRFAFRANSFTFSELNTNGDFALLPEDLRRTLHDYHAQNHHFEQFESYSEMVQAESLRRFAGILDHDQLGMPGYDTGLELEFEIRTDYSPEEAEAARQRLLNNGPAVAIIRTAVTAHVSNIARTNRSRLLAIDIKNRLQQFIDQK